MSAPRVDFCRARLEVSEKECERLRLQLASLTTDWHAAIRELDEARRWRMPDTSTPAFEEAFFEFEKVDRSWMTREDLVCHYVCAIANWNIVLDERDDLQARLNVAKKVIDTARHAASKAGFITGELHEALELYDAAWDK